MLIGTEENIRTVIERLNLPQKKVFSLLTIQQKTFIERKMDTRLPRLSIDNNCKVTMPCGIMYNIRAVISQFLSTDQY